MKVDLVLLALAWAAEEPAADGSVSTLASEAAMAIGVDMLSAHSLPTAPSRSAVGLYREYCVTV